ncbi:pre-neck appendage protein [Vibrio phage 526E57-1]
MVTKTNNRMIDGATVNVVDFGADPTGALDSTAAIQNALDSGLNVYFAEGSYSISDSIRVKTSRQNLSMRGATLVPTSNDFHGIIIEADVDYVVINGGWINFPSAGTGNGLELELGNHNCRFTDMVVNNANVGFNSPQLSFLQEYVMCRANFCNEAFYIKGSRNNGSGNGTTLRMSQCYANSCVQGFNIVEMNEVNLDTCAIDNNPSVTGAFVTINLCTTVNITNLAFENEPAITGSRWQGLFIISTQSVRVNGLKMLFNTATSSHFIARLSGVRNINFFGLTLKATTMSRFYLSNNLGINTRIRRESWTDTDFGDDTSANNGTFEILNDDVSSAIVAGSITTTGSSNIPTGIAGLSQGSVVITLEDSSAYVVPVIRDVFSNGDVAVNFWNLDTGSGDNTTPYKVHWMAARNVNPIELVG